MVGLLQALPGTALFERMRLQGRLRGSSTGDNVDGSTNIIPAQMSLAALREGYESILQSIYSRGGITSGCEHFFASTASRKSEIG